MLKKMMLTFASIIISTAVYPAEITGAGATFPFPVYAKWADSFGKETSNKINYQSIGSGAGIKQIQAKTVTFGATDMPMTKEELDKNGLFQFPTVIGGNVMVINVEGIKPGELVLTGSVIADIYLGKVKKWNDESIAKLNPDIKLPNINIVPIRRSDGSGTTFIFTNYLSKVSEDWKSKIGEGASVEWPVGLGAKGNEGVSGNVLQTKGAIGYVEYSYAKQNNMTHTALINSNSKVVQPGTASFQAAASAGGFDVKKGFYSILTNAPGDQAWPIAGATFILIYNKPVSKEDQNLAIKFFEWAYKNGDKTAIELDYVPMPEGVKNSIISSWPE